MLELEAAVERILALMPPPQPERVALAEAHGRVLAARIESSSDLPPFDNSAVDGYAVRAADLQVAGAASPTSLKLIGRVAAGETFSGEVAAGTCVRIFTGSPLPRGADAVAMQEDTRTESGKPEAVLFTDTVKPWENIRFRGEDLKRGAAIGEPAQDITAGRLQLLSAAGIAQVSVGRRPTIGLLATGSELVEPGESLSAGKIHESNRLTLSVLIRGAGGVPVIFPLVRDTAAETRSALEAALARSDILVTSGGVSVGETDFVKSAFESLGGKLEFWKVAIRPGRPFVFGRLGGKFLFGLPGNPVSAFVTFLLLVRSAIRRWQGAGDVTLPSRPGVLAEPLFNPAERRHFLRVMMDASGKVRSAGAQASHILGSLAAANGLVDVPPKTTLPAGGTVPVLCWE